MQAHNHLNYSESWGVGLNICLSTLQELAIIAPIYGKQPFNGIFPRSAILYIPREAVCKAARIDSSFFLILLPREGNPWT